MYFNHAFKKLFVGTHASQAAVGGTSAAVDVGFLNQAGIPSSALSVVSAPYSLGVGVFGLFYENPNTGLTSFNAATVVAGKPALLASTALYQHDKIGPFAGGYKESTKSKHINPKYVTRFVRVDPCTPNQNIIHIGNTPFTAAGELTLTITSGGTGYTNGTFANVPLLPETYSTGTVTQAANTVTGVGTTFVAGMVGGTIAFADGSVATITAFGSATSLTVNISQTITVGETYTVTYPSTGNGATANLTIAGGIITIATVSANGFGYLVGQVLQPSTNIVGVPTVEAKLTVATVESVSVGNCCKQFVCDETYFLRIDVKGSPELRYLSRNAYWNMDFYTGCCPDGCIAPLPVDSTLVMIGWANQIINNVIVGPFIQPVVYDQNGNPWYSPGTTGLNFTAIATPGVGTATITNAGTGYTDGVYKNIYFATTSGSGQGASANVTVAGGIVTVVTINYPGTNYNIGDQLTLPLLEGATNNAVFTVATVATPTWNNYVSPGYITNACAGMKLVGAYVDTRFGDCTFYPSDFFEKQPVNIYASEVDETGDPCEFAGICVVTQCAPRQGNGFGDQVLKDLILSESYMQNFFYTGKDLRIREVTQGYDVSNAINRSLLYTRYLLLHSVPRFNNPSGVFDNDQYLLEVITTATSPSFEATVAAMLSGCSCATQLEVSACGPTCQ